MVSPKKDSTRKRPSAENQGTELLGFKAKINKLLLPYSHFKSDSSKRKKKKKNHLLFPGPAAPLPIPAGTETLPLEQRPGWSPFPAAGQDLCSPLIPKHLQHAEHQLPSGEELG